MPPGSGPPGQDLPHQGVHKHRLALFDEDRMDLVEEDGDDRAASIGLFRTGSIRSPSGPNLPARRAANRSSMVGAEPGIEVELPQIKGDSRGKMLPCALVVDHRRSEDVALARRPTHSLRRDEKLRVRVGVLGRGPLPAHGRGQPPALIDGRTPLPAGQDQYRRPQP